MNNNLGFNFTFNSVKTNNNNKTNKNNKNNNNKNNKNNNNNNNNRNNNKNNKKTATNMKWGTVTWILFHWLAANINEEFYQRSSEQLHKIIKNILYNLPCPTCKQHAIQFLKDYDIKKAKTKSQFIQYFYFFHNKVNNRKNMIIPNRSILDTYTKMNGVNIINEWNNNFKNILGINLNDFMNKRNIEFVKRNMITFLKSNKQHFSNL